jgi:hypothetical protein
LLKLCAQRIGSAERDALTGMDCVSLAVPRRFAFTFTNRDDGVVAVFRGFNPISTWLKGSQSLIRSIHLENAVAVETTDANVESTRAQLNLNGAVVKVEEREAGIGSEVDGCRSQLHFSTPVAISPQPVAGRHWTIRHRLHPLLLAGWLE